jgi:hypothetical protein
MLGGVTKHRRASSAAVSPGSSTSIFKTLYFVSDNPIIDSERSEAARIPRWARFKGANEIGLVTAIFEA